MARIPAVPSVLICLAGMLTLVVGMPQAKTRNSGPSAPEYRPGKDSSRLGVGAGGDGTGPQSKAFLCPGCSEAFDSRRALNCHRSRYTNLLGQAQSAGEEFPWEGCASDGRRPTESTWRAEGQRAGGRVHNVSGPPARVKGFMGDQFDSTDSEPEPAVGGGRSRSPSAVPASDHRLSPPHLPGPVAPSEPAAAGARPRSSAAPAPSPPAPARSRPEVCVSLPSLYLPSARNHVSVCLCSCPGLEAFVREQLHT
jgi:hypothetical protein